PVRREAIRGWRSGAGGITGRRSRADVLRGIARWPEGTGRGERRHEGDERTSRAVAPAHLAHDEQAGRRDRLDVLGVREAADRPEGPERRHRIARIAGTSTATKGEDDEREENGDASSRGHAPTRTHFFVLRRPTGVVRP